ncbi:MAG: hypothetical protein HC880_05495 [Bacteroidia bacterium]|nr:hypothetical protein [Bacteroidia bacterium]
MNKNTRCYGSPEDLPPKVSLRAGRLSVIYQSGFLRYIKLGSTEIIRMINHTVRDENWGTLPLIIQDETIEDHGDSFIIRYRAQAEQGHIRFAWQARIEGQADSLLRFEIEGTALSKFKKNRAGFTVLHPIRECVGQLVEITHPEGTLESAVFPELISPHQPFVNIQQLSWPVNNDLKVHLYFIGDIFETEDQRNWTDASFKTYCTPLSQPFPVTLQSGDTIWQSILLDFEGEFRH